MRKALLISNMYPTAKTPYYGVFVQKLEESLSPLGIKIVAKSIIRGLERNKLLKVFKYIKFAFSLFRNLYLKNGYDLIYFHFVPLAVSPIYFYKKRNPNVKVIVNFHGGYLVDFSGAPFDRSDKLRLVADLAVVPSLYIAHFLADNYDWDPKDIFVSPSGGVDLQTFDPGPVSLNSNTHPIKIGFVSRVSEGKGWQVYVDALAMLKNKGLAFKGVIIGGGTQHKLLQQQLKDHNLQSEVEVVGPVSHLDLPGYLRTLNIKVFSTELFESLGLVGIEAMACGVPVIGSDIGGLGSYIKHGHNGFLFEPGDANALSRMILEYLELSSEERDLLSSRAKETAQQFDSQKVAIELYNRLESLF